MTRRGSLLVVSIPVLTIVTISLLVADQHTDLAGMMIGAYASLCVLALVGALFVVQPELFTQAQIEEVAAGSDDVGGLVAHHAPNSVPAETVTREQPQPAPPARVLPERPQSWSPGEPPREAHDPFTVVAAPASAPTDRSLEPQQDTSAIAPSRAAEIFVNIGRRNKQLNTQMLNLISHLERDELDPETLQGLYELDHLATRMRRNEETLLMLASSRKVRQWSPPVKLEDVLRSALAEVERFARVELDHVPDVLVVGAAVSEISHLLAELIDNATQFSHASTLVTVAAHTTLEGLEIEVLDTGHGIDEKKLSDLNELLRHAPALADAPSRRLGLFIVSRIASDHSITVELLGERGVGTVASVSLPLELLIEAAAEQGADSESSMEALDLLDPVLQMAVGAELEEDEEEALADATLPTVQEVAEALPSFPSVAITEPSSLGAVESTPFPGVPAACHLDEVEQDSELFEPEPAETSLAQLPSRIPQATFPLVWGQDSPNRHAARQGPEVLPGSGAATPSTDEPFDDTAAARIAGDAASSIIAFSSGVARGVIDGAQEHTSDFTTDEEDV